MHTKNYNLNDESSMPLIVILGPTASGKSDLAIKLAKKFNGEIVSADSRQVYIGLDIGTGKVTMTEQKLVWHHLLDVTRPGERFTVARYKRLADKAIKDISKRGKLPFLVGGSALYIKAVVEGYVVPEVAPDWKLRREFEAQTLGSLLKILKKFDRKTYDRIDKKNPRRVIRALEIIYKTGKPIPQLEKEHPYEALMIGIDIPRKKLYRRIDERVDSRAKKGMIREVERLIEDGASKKWLKSLGLEYRCITEYLEQSVIPSRFLGFARNDKQEMLQKLKFAIHDFARRQMTWFRAQDVQWIRNQREAEKIIRSFYSRVRR